MIQFIFVVSIVGAFTAIFFGVPAALAVGRTLTVAWIATKVLIFILRPILDLFRSVRLFFNRASGIFRHKSA
jgi:hypothetical protein